MTLKSLLTSLDRLHPPPSATTKRSLRANVFGVEVPAWILFHTTLGYVLLAAGLSTIALRLPLKPVKRLRWLHPYLGYVWVFGTIWMPVTAIWCVYSFTGWDVIAFFIFSLFAAVQLGWLCIRYFRTLGSRDAVLAGVSEGGSRKWRHKIWKWLHAGFMIYSFCMLLGAGISFPFRAIDNYANV